MAFYDYSLTPAEVTALFNGHTTVGFTATTNDQTDYTFNVGYGRECQLFWNNGGCGGIDNGRCGVTSSGELYAWYLDAKAWCDGALPRQSELANSDTYPRPTTV